MPSLVSLAFLTAYQFTFKQTDRQKNGETDRQSDEETNRQMGRQSADGHRSKDQNRYTLWSLPRPFLLVTYIFTKYS